MISAERPATGIDMEKFRLRNFVDALDSDQIERHDEPLTLAGVAALLEGNPRAVLFSNINGKGESLVGNALGSRERMARAFGVTPDKLLGEILRRLRRKPEFVEVSSDEAPVHQVILTGANADVTKLPVHLHHGRDGGPYISAALDISMDVSTGWTNVGLRRLMLRGRHETGIDLVAVSDLRNIYQAAVARGERLPLSIVVGSHPIDYFAATMRLPGDEIGLISSLRDAPLATVKSVTNDIRVPADAEYVIEGYLGDEGYIEKEGPFGEFLGYYGGVKTNPVFHVTAITHRKDALFQTLTISGKTMSRTDTAQLTTLRTEVLVWRALEVAVREPVAVYASPATGGVYNVRCAIRQRNAGEARNAIAAVMGCMGEREKRLHRGSRYRRLLRRSDGMGPCDASARRARHPRRHRLPRVAARPHARAWRQNVGQVRLRSHAAVRRRQRYRAQPAGTARLHRSAFSIGSRRTRRRPEAFRTAHGGARHGRRS